MALFGGSVLLLLTFIYWSTARYMAQQADATIEAEIAGLAELYRGSGLGGLTNTISARISRKPGGFSLYLLVDDDFQPVLGNINRWPAATAAQNGWLNFQLEAEGWSEGELHRARARAFQLHGGFHLLVGRDLHELQKTERLIIRTLGWGLAITLIFGLVGGSMMARGVVRRIEAINQTSRKIMSGDLTRRIPRDRSGDDFDELTANLNKMLDRIASLMDEVRRISDNIAHDLKTPLSRLRNSLEQLYTAQAGESENKRILIEQSIAEADGLLATFSALLRIARIESGERRAAFVEIDLRQLLTDVVDFYAPLAEEKRVSLELTANPTARIDGDRDLLFQAFANLLDNAIKYTPPQGGITVDLSEQDGHPRVTVTDSGPGIPEAEHEHVFQRFYRLEDSRAQPGNGLGLTLVDVVARLHGTKITLEDNAPGLRVTLEF